MRTLFVNIAWLLGTLALLAVTGCASVSADRINASRMDYGQVIAESWKRQTLLNVVRMRYADAPVFLDVASVIDSYTVGGNANALATLPSRTDPDVLELGAGAAWSNTPTVTYQPLLGEQFTRSLLQPIPPMAVFQLLQAGWPATLVMSTTVRSINGLRNDSLGVGADPGFYQLNEALSRIQRSGSLGIRVEPRKEGNAVVVVIRRGDNGAAVSEDSRLVQKLLGLEEGIREFDISYGLLPRSNHEVALNTRSMLELFLELGVGVELPANHAMDGRATPGLRQAGDAEARPLVHIHSGKEAPADVYAAVQYKGYWYWIDDTDIASKRTFTFLMILSSLAQTGESTPAPVVTVPSR
jgi:hypothetical protein